MPTNGPATPEPSNRCGTPPAGTVTLRPTHSAASAPLRLGTSVVPSHRSGQEVQGPSASHPVLPPVSEAALSRGRLAPLGESVLSKGLITTIQPIPRAAARVLCARRSGRPARSPDASVSCRSVRRRGRQGHGRREAWATTGSLARPRTGSPPPGSRGTGRSGRRGGRPRAGTATGPWRTTGSAARACSGRAPSRTLRSPNVRSARPRPPVQRP